MQKTLIAMWMLFAVLIVVSLTAAEPIPATDPAAVPAPADAPPPHPIYDPAGVSGTPQPRYDGTRPTYDPSATAVSPNLTNVINDLIDAKKNLGDAQPLTADLNGHKARALEYMNAAQAELQASQNGQ